MTWEIGLLYGIEGIFLGIGTFFDLKQQSLPRMFLILFSVIAGTGRLLVKGLSIKAIGWGILPGIVILLIARFTKEKIGYGDGWGILILGVLKELPDLLCLLLIAFSISGIWGMWHILVRKKSPDDTIPFYPCLFGAWLGGLL